MCDARETMRTTWKTSKEQTMHELLPTSGGGKARIGDKMRAAEKPAIVYYNMLCHIIYVYIIMILLSFHYFKVNPPNTQVQRTQCGLL